MPLVKIDVYKGVRSPAELQVLADTIHEALMHAFSAPLKDRFQASLFLSYDICENPSTDVITTGHHTTRARGTHHPGQWIGIPTN